MRNPIFSLLLLATSLPVLAAPADPDNYWQCMAYDSDNRQWIAKNTWQRAAINFAYDNCKKESKNPASCKTAKEYCESYLNGVPNQPMWQCVAIDLQAVRWLGTIFMNRDEAILGAKSYCQEQSVLPETCFVSFLMCKSLAALDN